MELNSNTGALRGTVVRGALVRGAVALSLLGGSFALAACSGGGGTNTNPGGGGGGGEDHCPMDAPNWDTMSGPCCALQSNSDRQDAPEFRMAALKLSTPSTLATQLIDNLLKDVTATQLFNWAIRLDIVGSDVTMTTGNGIRNSYDVGATDDSIRFDDSGRYDIETLSGTISGDTVTMNPIVGTFVVPIVRSDGVTEQFQLPLRDLHVKSFVMSENRTCVGTQDATDGFDYTQGQLEAYFTVEDTDAKEITLGAISKTLCGFAAGISASRCANADKSTWSAKPDAKCGTSGSCVACNYAEDNTCDAWKVVGQFGLMGVEID